MTQVLCKYKLPKNKQVAMQLKWIIFLLLTIFSVIAISVSIRKLAVTTDSSKGKETKPEVPLVTTPNGKYLGILSKSQDGSQLMKFMGMPFAQPPLGELRFKRPRPLTKGNPETVYHADKAKQSCLSETKPSTNARYGEDCLYLNVYVPGNHSVSREAERPQPSFAVMVWLHPGGFVAGSAFPEPIKLVTRGNVIVVMVNYRMGVLGFLTTNDDDLPGNNGLWDQYMAIKWTRDNIRHFGGDENLITVFGMSAGAMSSHIHALSPVSSPLFHKVILQSGTAPSMIAKDYTFFAYSFAKMVGCGAFSNHSELARCLRKVSVSEIRQHDVPQNFDITSGRKRADFIWMPVVDGNMIVDHPSKLLKNQSYLERVGALEKDYMIGVSDDEGALMPDNFLDPIPLSALLDKSLYQELVEYFLYANFGLLPNQTEQLIKVINNFYFRSNRSEPALTVPGVLDLSADAIFVNFAVETSRALSACNKSQPPLCESGNSSEPKPESFCSNATAKVFFYLFDYCPDVNPCRAPCMYHGADFMYEFPKSSLGAEAVRMSDIFIDLLTTFAKTSNPGSAIPSGWPAFEPHWQNYLRLSPEPAVRRNMYQYRANLWLDVLPSLIG